jgi:transcriptional regulator with XRE-family HTH domain
MFEGNVKIKDLKEEIGLLVKSYRKRDKLSRKELAEQLNVSRITIQNLESGMNFTIDTLLKVLLHFDAMVALNDFIIEKRKENDEVESLY